MVVTGVVMLMIEDCNGSNSTCRSLRHLCHLGRVLLGDLCSLLRLDGPSRPPGAKQALDPHGCEELTGLALAVEKAAAQRKECPWRAVREPVKSRWIPVEMIMPVA